MRFGLDKIEARLRARFVRLQGEGEEHQFDIYRCDTCAKPVTWNMIREGRGYCCGNRLKPSTPGFFEGLHLLLWKI
jgi:hypothetical protein